MCGFPYHTLDKYLQKLQDKGFKVVIAEEDNPDQTRDEAFSTQDFISDLEAKYNAEDYYFEQELMDLFRPSAEHDKAWDFKMFVELLFYSGMPESYSKTVHQMVLDEEEAERNFAQANM